MSKKPISWIELIKIKLDEEKSKGKSPSINDIMPEAKKDWAQIKAGTHPKYIQGKAKTYARKKKNSSDGNNKTRKGSKKSSSSSSGSIGSSSDDIKEIMDQVKMCGKCKKKVEKILSRKNMKGGYNQFYDATPKTMGPIGTSDGSLTANIPGNPLPNPVPFLDNDPVTGYDPNMPTFAQLGGGKKKKGGNKKQKGGGCGGVCGGTSLPTV